MTQDTKATAQTAAEADYEAVRKQLAALREDMTRLADTVTSIAGRRTSNIATDIVEGFGEARRYTERTGKTAEDQLEASVAAHPLLAIGLAAGAGLLVGAMSRR